MSKTGDAGMRFEMALSFLEDGDVTQALKWLDKAFESAEATDIASFAEQIAAKPNLDLQFTNRFAENMDSTRLAVAREALDAENPDYASVESLVKELAEKGNPEAQYLLATVYRLADDTLHDTAKYVEWIQKAAAGGWKAAKEQIAEETSQTDKWAEQGDAMGMCMAAAEYRDGKTLSGLPHEKDILKAIELFEKAFAAGAKEGAKELARMYEEGDCVAEDLVKSHEWSLKAAELGDVASQISVGANYLRGNGVSKDAVMAVKWFKKAAEQGSHVGMRAVGDSFKYGWGVNVDTTQAAAWYEKAIAETDADDDPSFDAMRELAELLIEGVGVEKDVLRAVELLTKASDAGEKESQLVLASLYLDLDGTGTIVKNIDKGIELLRRSAEQGFAMAEYVLAGLYAQGLYVKMDVIQALRWNEKAAEHGNGDAADAAEKLRRSIGKMRENGLSDEEINKRIGAVVEIKLGEVSLGEFGRYYDKDADIEQQKHYMQIVSGVRNDDPKAMYEFADALFYGMYGAVKNREVSIVWYTKSAEKGYVDAQWDLAELYFKGDDIEEDNKKAFLWYKKAAENGHVKAMDMTGICIFNGYGTIEDESASIEWFVRSAEAGCPEGQYHLGLRYFNGQGVEENNDEAFNWFAKAAEKGEKNAQYYLGFCYLKGYGTNADEVLAVSWFEKAAKNGLAKAKRQMGDSHRLGRGNLEEDDVAALEWYKKAAESDDAAAQYWLAEFYEDGRGGLTVDLGESFAWRLSSAINGDVDSMNCVGWAYQKGLGTEIDAEESVKWYQKAVKEGSAKGMNNLAKCYEDGFGVEKNVDRALELFSWSAEKGFVRGCYHLGRFYENGIGVDVDIEEAKKWYQKAADADDDDAKAALERLG